MPRVVKVDKDDRGVSVEAADGRVLTLRRGLRFPERPRATEFLQDFAKAQGKRLVINKKKSGGAQYEYVCASATPCGFRVKLLKSRSANASHFFVSSFDVEHSPECSGAAKITVRQAAAALASAGATVANVKELQEELSKASGETISARKAYRVRDRILTMAAGEFQRGFQRLQSLLQGFRDKNAGAPHVAFEADELSGSFQRCFLAHPFARHYQGFLQPVLGLDSAQLASMSYRGTLFVLVGKDGDNQDVYLAIGVAPTPDVEHCQWFLEHCGTAGVDLSRASIVADRARGMLPAANKLGLQLRQCTRHIVTNLKLLVKNLATVQVQDLVWRAQAAETSEEFNSCLNMVGLTCPAAENYLRGIDPMIWAGFCCADRVKLYGWNTTNFNEDENRSLLCLAPYDVIQQFMEVFMESAYTRSTLAAEWVKDGNYLTPYATKLLDEQQEAANFQVVQPSDQRVAYVTESRSFPPRRYRINVDQRECSCPFMYQTGIPCRHFLAGLAFFKRMDETHDCVDGCYLTTSFARQYDPQVTGSIELLLDDELRENPDIKAPVIPKKRGRPKSVQLPTSGEPSKAPAPAPVIVMSATGPDLSSTESAGGPMPTHLVGPNGEKYDPLLGGPPSAKRRCSTCGQVGHSKRTCERGLPPPAELIQSSSSNI